ncbi:MAG TPA: ABC transporter permease [Thermoanaerobaculia bacterium]|jgi:ABC-2 type transport system permease protein|nr:ABC transporter permease [Thermoanaerobaculia bacterium]
MSALAGTPETVARAAAPARRRLGRIYWLEAKAEARKAMRLPAFVLPLFAFPIMFYLLFGLAMHYDPLGGVSIAVYLLATYGAFGVMNAALFGFGIGVAAERGQGWLLLKRATPMPPLALFAGKLAMSLLFAVGIVGALIALGVSLGHVRVPAATLAELAAVLVAGALPFAALGLAVGYWAGPNSAPALCNLLSLPMAFASGLWIPFPMLPSFVRQIAHGLPAYHLARLALGVIGAGNREPAAGSVLYLAGFTVAMLALARAGYLRDEGRTYG